MKLTSARLIDPGFVCEPQDPHLLQDVQSTQGIAVGGVFRTLKAHRHMALGTEVVDLIRLHVLNNPDQVGAVSEIALVQNQARITLVGILVKMIDPTGVERARTPLNPMNLVAPHQQQLSQVASTLPGDASDQGGFGLYCGHRR